MSPARSHEMTWVYPGPLLWSRMASSSGRRADEKGRRDALARADRIAGMASIAAAPMLEAAVPAPRAWHGPLLAREHYLSLIHI